LKAIVLDERLLQRIELAILRQPFNRRDFSLSDENRKDGAGMSDASVDQDGASTAITRLASPSGSR
jgi:hypothetical protein